MNSFCPNRSTLRLSLSWTASGSKIRRSTRCWRALAYRTCRISPRWPPSPSAMSWYRTCHLRTGSCSMNLVHVEQYRQLGGLRFSELYVRGFLSGGGYDGIPLEVNAYALGRRFEGNPRQQFSVADEVARWVREDRF